MDILGLTEPIAKEFSATIRKWLTDEQLAEVIRLNEQDTSTQGTHNPFETNDGISICHTHDFCDSAMLMFEIISDDDKGLADYYEQIVIDQGGLPDDQAEYSAFFTAWNQEAEQKIQTPETTPLMTLWNDAWAMAKANKFYRDGE